MFHRAPSTEGSLYLSTLLHLDKKDAKELTDATWFHMLISHVQSLACIAHTFFSSLCFAVCAAVFILQLLYTFHSLKWVIFSCSSALGVVPD